MPAVIRPARCFHHGTASCRGQLRSALRVHRHRRTAGVRGQRTQDLVGALESLGRVLREAAEDDFGDWRWACQR